jgi:maltooligosyltrehalose trehalohydrolase
LKGSLERQGTAISRVTLGAVVLGEGRVAFKVWAPAAREVKLRLVRPREKTVTLEPEERGYHQGLVEGVEPGSLYLFRLDNKERPDPASRLQPEGVHGPSQVVDPAFDWQDRSWKGLPLEEYIVYELHVGTFSQTGTFESALAHLDELRELGVTAVEVMPVAQFPGSRNWGYDGVYPFSVQSSYGGPAGFKRWVDGCHARGMAVVLDVVYNHLGPEGNYLADFGPYFNERYRTPWGPALNFDGPHSDEVRRYFIENALLWIEEFHLDALRLDAVHAVLDLSARPFLLELGEEVKRAAQRLGRQVFLIPESDLNDSRLLRPPERGGLGLDAQWSDDFHHALHVLLTGEESGYYQDFGGIEPLGTALREGYVFSGQRSPFRKRRHGNSARDLPGRQFVVFSQNHDQVGNRMQGDRLSALVSVEELKLAAGAVLLSPYLPLLFMGEEYGEKAPFLFFTSHSDPGLIQAVRRGRREEFAAWKWKGEPPDPQDEKTFLRSKLNHLLRHEPRHQAIFEYYRELIRLRKELAPLAGLNRKSMEVTVFEKERALAVRRFQGGEETLLVLGFAGEPRPLSLSLPAGNWRKRLDSTEERWGGPGSSVPETLLSAGPPGKAATLAAPARGLCLFTRPDR